MPNYKLYVECHDAELQVVECHNAELQVVECHNAECHNVVA
jgi:hypothetical protein